MNSLTCDNPHCSATIASIQAKYHREVKRANELRALLAGPSHYAQQRIDNADYPSDVLTPARLYDQDKLIVKIRELMRIKE
jgi:hypothetical protein